MTERELIKLLAHVELARRNFYYFCTLLFPTIYKKDRLYLKEICDKLQEFWEDDKKRVLCLSMPPRHGKTYTMNLFCLWLIGRDKHLRTCTCSYNANFATDSTKFLRDTIQEEKIDKDTIIYSDVFDSSIAFGTAKKNLFKVEGSRFNFSAMSASLNMSPMGRGLNLEIFDDLFSSSMDALSERYQENIWNWIKDTMLNRLEYCQDITGRLTKKGKKLIFLNTIWTLNDPIIKIQDFFNEDEITVLKFKALQDDGSMLCDEILSLEDYERYKKIMDESIFYAMYQNEPLELKDRLYLNFNTYHNELEDIDKTFAICDPAAEGKDSLSMIIASTSKKDPNKIFIRDVYFTNKLDENFQEIIAKRLTKFEVTHFRYESNGVGAFFGQLIKQELEKLENDFTIVKSFNQKQKKDTKIFSKRQLVENFIYYPENFERYNADFWKELINMKATTKNEHDDAADSLTELVLMAINFKYIDILKV